MTASRSRADAAALAAHALVVLALFRRLLVGDTLFYRDFSRYALPLRVLVADAVRAHRLPLWNPYSWLGTPLAANPAAGLFYPLHWPFLALSPLRALNLSVPLHVWLGGVFAYALARTRVEAGSAPLVAAVGFSAGGIVLGDGNNPLYLYSLTWLPAVLWCFRRALDGGLRPVLLGGAAFALMLLGGDVQLPLLCGLCLVAGAIWAVAAAPSHGVPTAPSRGVVALRAFGFVAGAGLLALLLAAVQLLPALELAPLSERALALSADERAAFSFPPLRLITFFIPDFFGVPFPDNSYWGFDIGSGPEFWFASVYSGALITLLALLAIPKLDAVGRGFAVAALVLISLAFGAYLPLYEMAAQIIPGLSRFRYPEKYLAPLSLFLPLFAAEGVARLQPGEMRRAIMAGAVLLAMLGAALWLGESQARTWLAARSTVPSLAPAAARRLAGDGGALLCLAVAALVTLASRRVALLSLVACADVALAGARLVWTEPTALLTTPSPLAAGPRAVGPPRLARLSALDRLPLHRSLEGAQQLGAYLRRSLQPNLNVVDHVALFNGYGAGAPAEAHLLLGRLPPRALGRLAARLSTTALLVPGEPPPDGTAMVQPLAGATPRARLDGARVAEETLAGAAAWLDGAVLGPPLIDAAHALVDGDLVPAAEARALTAQLPRDGAGSARLVSYAPEAVQLQIDAVRPSLLVLTDAFFPGWRATVDGAETPIFRADLLARAVAVPAGRHDLRFTYQCPGLGAGARLSLASLLAFAALLLLDARRRRAE